MRTTITALTLVAILSWPALSSAQSQSPPRQTPVGQSTRDPKPAVSDTAPRKRFEPYVSLASAFDTNIEHNKTNIDSWGGVFGAGFFFRSNPSDPAFELNAEIAGHEWTNTGRWDRFSEKVIASYDHDLPGRWSFDTSGEVSLQGSSEDRELSDQYVIVPRIAYRIGSQNRVRAYVGLRARRYDDDPDRNAFNRYIGVEFTERAQPERRFEVDVRYEVNETDSPRQHYNRWTLGLGYSLPVGGDRLETEVRYRMQYYPFRQVEVDDVDVNRRDHRWIPRAVWVHPLATGMDLRASYTFETRTSNDLDREFKAHLFSVSAVRRW